MAHDPSNTSHAGDIEHGPIARTDPSTGERFGRGTLLAGLGAAGLGLAATLAPPIADARPPRPPGAAALPVLETDDDWAEVLAVTPQVQLDPSRRYVLEAPVDLPGGTVIEGHGAVVTTSSTAHGAFLIDRADDITIRDVRLHGCEDAVVDMPLTIKHTAIRASRATNLRILDCDLIGWQGAGIAVSGDSADDYFSYGIQIFGCRFETCYIGLSATDRCEYSLLSASMFTSCRLAIWNSSGNWNLSGNVIVGCHGAYYAIAATSPFGDLSADNWNHGSITGCTMNHANQGAPQLWTAQLAFPIGGTERDPGPGVVIEGLLPPTFTANTLWYTDVTARDLPASVWNLTGCALSDLRIAQDGGAPVRLIGHQSNGGPEHAPVLAGDVSDAFAR